MILLVWLMPPSDGAGCVMGLEAAHYLRQYNLYAF
jgi:hypothetical protein